MAATTITDDVKANAEVYYDDAVCQVKSKLLLQEVGLPRGLLPLKDIVECGYVEETGFVWLKQKQRIDHVFVKIGRKVSYAQEITAFVEKNKIKKLTGVKAKEMLLWLNLNEIEKDDVATAAQAKVTFRTSTGMFRTFSAEAFELRDDVDGKFEVVARNK